MIKYYIKIRGLMNMKKINITHDIYCGRFYQTGEWGGCQLLPLF